MNHSLSEPASYEDYLLTNRQRINSYLNKILRICILTGPAIAIGLKLGLFSNIKYSTCMVISVVMAVVAIIHFGFSKLYPNHIVSTIMPLVALDLLIVRMNIGHVEIYLTWFLVPLLSLMYTRKAIYMFSVVVNYICMAVSVWVTAPYYNDMSLKYTTPLERFLDTMGGFTIEMLLMVAAGYAICIVSEGYLRELFAKYDQEKNHQKEIANRMDIMDSMAEIYDNINLIDFTKKTETSLRDDSLTEYYIDMPAQDHTKMSQGIRPHVAPDQAENFWDFTNITTVPKRLKNKKIISADYLAMKDGWFRSQYITVNADDNGVPTRVIYTTRNIDDEKRREEHLIRISMTDELTRLYNRRSYEEDIEVLRKEGMDDELVLLSVDVNGLKKANDTMGHAAGDELIRAAADCLSASVGVSGKVYRTGGDEFFAIVHTADPKGLLTLIQKNSDQWHGSYNEKLSMSAGYASRADHPDMTIDDLEHEADAMMYANKNRYYGKRV